LNLGVHRADEGRLGDEISQEHPEEQQQDRCKHVLEKADHDDHHICRSRQIQGFDSHECEQEEYELEGQPSDQMGWRLLHPRFGQ
jgi:hypothetical protein